ncbi:MAG: dihydrodipicolinate synthase family protein [Chloroflexota bacterium]
MHAQHPLAGIYAAALTPFRQDYSVDLDQINPFLNHLASRDCHGALLFGTTGEGPSLGVQERFSAIREAVKVRKTFPEFKLLAGTGTPSLEETIEITRNAFELGCEGVVVLPPYYFRKVSDEGLFNWFAQVIQRAVPEGGYLLGYHIPAQSGVPLSMDLLARLKEAFPEKFAGIKDSSGDPDHAAALGKRFGSELLVLNGYDGLLLHALEHSAGGAITAMANLYSPLLDQVWDIFSQDGDALEAQDELNKRRLILDKYMPFPPILKAVLPEMRGFSRWELRPPLLSLPDFVRDNCIRELRACDVQVND